nr:hypothetical protein [Tanacetum cinerariifolium]
MSLIGEFGIIVSPFRPSYFRGAEVELLEPGFELHGSKMVEMDFFNDPRIIREQRIVAYKGYRGGGVEEEHVEDVTAGDATQGDDTATYREVPTVSQEPSIPSPTPPTPLPQPPQDLPSTSQVQHTLPQSPQAQPQPQPQPQQTADFPMSLLQEVLDACVALT